MTQINLASLFEDEPKQWGLRGDPLLWREMKSIIISKEIGTASDFPKVMEDLFVELTQCRPESGTSIYVERYDLEGMSSGYVSSKFWLEKAFPMLIDRYVSWYNNKEKDSK